MRCASAEISDLRIQTEHAAQVSLGSDLITNLAVDNNRHSFQISMSNLIWNNENVADGAWLRHDLRVYIGHAPLISRKSVNSSCRAARTPFSMRQFLNKDISK